MWQIEMCKLLGRFLLALFLLPPVANIARAHDGPDPIAKWRFIDADVKGTKLTARFGPDLTFSAPPSFHSDSEFGQSMIFDGRGAEAIIANNISEIRDGLPTRDFTVAAWVAIEEPIDNGAIVGAFQDNGGSEQGWLLGYRGRKFTFALSTVGSNDGDGMMTYLDGQTEFERGRMYHVVAVYDGTTMQLFVNGKLDAESTSQSGDVLYPAAAPCVIGCYHDDNEFNPLTGRIRDLAIYDLAAKPKWIAEEFGHHEKIATLAPVIRKSADGFVVKPYLQYGTTTGMTIAWRSAIDVEGIVHWGETMRCQNTLAPSAATAIAHARIEGLQPETQYFYFVASQNADGQVIESEISTFQTASLPETPFAFAVISDTQENPSVSGPIAELAWAQRPNFLLHSGDLVDRGSQADDWIDEFFSSMHPLISRVPMYPVLGNHEENAANYFDYMVLPDPEYYYQFSYGNADFFMIDSNRKVSEKSEQYKWLDAALAKSSATWKFVCHHHPPYSSDENDYGDLWKTNKSTRGDLRLRAMVKLYEKHAVDIVWNGHIHSYERTWPLKENRAVEVGGTIYMITGGGGGGLETPGPYRPFFQNNVRRDHHYTMVAINGGTLELKTFSLKDELFDTVRITKQPSATVINPEAIVAEDAKH